MNKITIFPGYDLPSHELQKLYRERYLKISQCEFCAVTGIKQPNLSAHESGHNPQAHVDKAFEQLNFGRWARSVATCEEEASMIEDMLDETSRLEYMTEAQIETLYSMRKRRPAPKSKQGAD